jgi:hypothetical protein
MFAINDAAKAKKSARALEKFLKKQGIDLGHGQGLNAIAAMAGFEDWNGLQAQLKGPQTSEFVPNIWDVDFNKVTLVNVFGGSYALNDLDDFDRVEYWLPKWTNTKNPFRGKNPIALRLESQNEDSYASSTLRVEELLSFKWDVKEQCFISPQYGRMSLYALAPYQFTKPEEEDVRTSQEASTQQRTHGVPTILDVDFSRVTGLKRGGEGFWVDSKYYPEALAWLEDWDNPANENDPDVPVLELTYIDDQGFAVHTQILANELLALKWSPSTGSFVSPTGVEYAFTADESIIPGTLPRGLPVVVKTEQNAKETPPKRFAVDVYSIMSDEDVCSGREHVETWEGVAASNADAEAKALAEYWTDELEQSGAEPSCDVREIDDWKDGSFTLLVPEGHSVRNAAETFSEAWKLGASLSNHHSGHRVVQIVDGRGNTVYVFDKK